MLKTENVKFGDIDVTVKELSVVQVLDWYEDMTSPTSEEDLKKEAKEKTKKERRLVALEGHLDREIPLSAVLLAVPAVSEEDILTFTDSFSEVANLYDEVEKLNPFLYKMAKKVVALAEHL